jgi:hypothetical protein
MCPSAEGYGGLTCCDPTLPLEKDLVGYEDGKENKNNM